MSKKPASERPARSITDCWRTFDVSDGLAGMTVHSVHEDQDGHLWFGTLDGVSRYDGDTFKNYTKQDGLLSNIVGSIFQDHEGDLWFGTVDGASRYDGKSFINFTAQDGLPGDAGVNAIAQDQE
ncbi:MAG: hypothetical protein IIA50_06960, partial [Bacteroidetes bacterium]|nr:hypothetical protein [Bacteroidota bacterium]